MERIKDWIEEHQLLAGVIVFAFFLVIYFAGLIVRRPKEAWLHVSFVNEYQNMGKGSPLYDDMVEAVGDSGKKIVFDTNYYFDLANDKDYSNGYYQKLVAYLEAGTTDAVIMNESNLSGIAKGGRLLDLSDERVKDAVEKYSDRFYFYTTEEGERIPVGISLSGSPYEESLGYTQVVYIGLSSSATHLDAVVLLLDQLFENS